MTLQERCPVLQFGDLGDERGKLVVIEGEQAIPFEIKRVFYIYGSDPDVIRGQHANRESEFVLINVAGKSKVRIADGYEEIIVELDKPMMGVYIPKMIWKDMYAFSQDSVLLVLASTHYNGSEYIRNYEEYLREIGQNTPLVSLCLPTNGVSEWVFPVLDSIYAQGVDPSVFEVVVTDNGNNEEFKKELRKYKEDRDNLTYIETETGPFLNEIASYKGAKGKLLKFVNHRTIVLPGTLQKLIGFAETNYDEKPIIFFSNGALNSSQPVREFDSFDGFINALSYWSSWSTGMTIWKEDFEKLPEKLDDFNELFPHTVVLFNERKRGKYIVDDSEIFREMLSGNKPKGNYNLFYAFGVEYPGIITSLYRDGDISADTCRNVLDQNLDFIISLYNTHIVRKEYCSYDLSGFDDMFGIFYSKENFRKKILRKKLMKKPVRKVCEWLKK